MIFFLQMADVFLYFQNKKDDVENLKTDVCSCIHFSWIQRCGSGGRGRASGRRDGGSVAPATVSNLGNFVHLILPVSEKTLKSRWSFLSLSMSGEVKYRKCVTCSGLINRKKGQL